MVKTRCADDNALKLQRQGRMLTYAPNTGQEAAQVGSAAAMAEKDWLVPAFRELGAWLLRGVDLEKVYLYWYGNEFGSQFPEHVRVLPIAVPIASQLQHAVGIAMASNIKGEKDVTVAYVGDGEPPPATLTKPSISRVFLMRPLFLSSRTTSMQSQWPGRNRPGLKLWSKRQ